MLATMMNCCFCCSCIRNILSILTLYIHKNVRLILLSRALANALGLSLSIFSYYRFLDHEKKLQIKHSRLVRYFSPLVQSANLHSVLVKRFLNIISQLYV